MKKLPDAEFTIMQAVWAKTPPVLVRDVVEQLGEANKWKRQTILSLMLRLVERGLALICAAVLVTVGTGMVLGVNHSADTGEEEANIYVITADYPQNPDKYGVTVHLMEPIEGSDNLFIVID